MFYQDNSPQDEFILLTLSQLVPENHLLRKIDKHIDFSFIYDLTSPYYSHHVDQNCLDSVYWDAHDKYPNNRRINFER